VKKLYRPALPYHPYTFMSFIIIHYYLRVAESTSLIFR